MSMTVRSAIQAAKEKVRKAPARVKIGAANMAAGMVGIGATGDILDVAAKTVLSHPNQETLPYLAAGSFGASIAAMWQGAKRLMPEGSMFVSDRIRQRWLGWEAAGVLGASYMALAFPSGPFWSGVATLLGISALSNHIHLQRKARKAPRDVSGQSQ